jgi:acyl-CoA thioesterase
MTSEPRPATPPASTEGLIPHLGLEIVERSEGRSLGRITIGPEHMNPHGVVHGAVQYAMADSGMGAATYTVLQEGESCATIEVKIVYLAPAREGVMECETRLVQRSRTIAVLESDVRIGEKLVAKALGTFAILPRR